MSARSIRSHQIPFYDILCTLQHSVGAYLCRGNPKTWHACVWKTDLPPCSLLFWEEMRWLTFVDLGFFPPITSSRLSLSTWVIGPSSVPFSQCYHLGTKNKKPSAYNIYIYISTRTTTMKQHTQEAGLWLGWPHHQIYFAERDSWGSDFNNTANTLWLFNIAMENGPFIDGLPIKNGDVPRLC